MNWSWWIHALVVLVVSVSLFGDSGDTNYLVPNNIYVHRLGLPVYRLWTKDAYY